MTSELGPKLSMWTPIQGQATTLGEHLTKFVDGYVDEMAADFVEENPSSYVAKLQNNNNQVIFEERGNEREWTVRNVAIDCLRVLTYLTVVIPVAMVALKIILRSARSYTVLQNERTTKEQTELKHNLKKHFGNDADPTNMKLTFDETSSRVDNYTLSLRGIRNKKLPATAWGEKSNAQRHLEGKNGFIFFHNHSWLAVETKDPQVTSN